MHTIHRLAAACLFVWALPAVQAADLRGQVLDADTRLPIEGAVIVLTNGTAAHTADSDVFGFFAHSGVADGVYTTLVTHPGYVPAVDTNVLSATGDVAKVYELVPALGGEGAGFDIFVQVTDADSGISLSDVPVRLHRFDLVGDTVPAEIRTAVTDSNGFTVIRGSRTGYYRFDANAAGSVRPRWLSYTTSSTTNDKRYIIKSHMANMMLKPGPLQDLDVAVFGYDPIADADDEPLANVYVELEGLDPANPQSVVLPARTGLTDTNGLVLFRDLPALSYRVTTKKMGYEPTRTILQPTNATADLLPNPLMVNITNRPSVLKIDLLTPYFDPAMMTGVFVRVQGLAGTATEGIFREKMSYDTGSEVTAIFSNIPPGRYRVIARGGLPSPTRVPLDCLSSSAFFIQYRAETYVEVEGTALTAISLALDPIPATVRVRLFAADEKGRTATELEDDGSERPIYRLVEQDDIRFIEEMPGNLLEPPLRTNIVATGEDGETVFTILPGIYGVSIPTMTNYTGAEALYYDEHAGTYVDIGWPYPDWPGGYGRDLDRHSCGLVFDSGGEYRIDLFVRKQMVDLRGDIDGDPANPTTVRILANPAQASEVDIAYSELAHDGGVMRLSGDNGIERTNSINDLTAFSIGALAEFQFTNLTAGTYDIWLEHPRHTSPTGTLTVAGWTAPGGIPPIDPTDPSYREAFTTISFEPPYTPFYTPTGMAQLLVYATNAIGGYDLIETIDTLQVVQPKTYATGRFFSAAGRMPDGTFEYWQHFPPHGWFNDTTSGAVSNEVYINGPMKNVSSNAGPDIPGYELNVAARSADDPDLTVDGVSVTMTGGFMFTTPGNKTGYTNPITVSSVIDPKWSWTGSSEISIDSLEPPVFTLTLAMMRGMGISGAVTRAGVPSMGIPGAQVLIRDRFGAILRTERTDSNGMFQAASALATFQTVFVDVRQHGYQPWRERLVPLVDAASTDLVVSAALEAIPGPVVEELTMNRYGLFLPGVRKSGDETLFNNLDADEALTMIWTARVTQAVYTNHLQRFDRPDGTTGIVDSLVVTDRVIGAWLVDKRTFPTNPYSDEAVSAPLPDATNGYRALRQWVAQAMLNPTNQRYTSRAPGGMDNGLPGGADTGSAIKLYELPAGTFDPSVLVFTEDGGVAILDHVYPSPTNQYALRGLRTPPWLATVLDTIGVISATQLTAEELKDVLPTGRFEALPRFTVEISEIDDDGFVLYTYNLDVEWTEGMDNLASGFLSIAPGTLGLSFEGNAGLTVNGQSGSADFGVTADIKTGDIELDDMLPKIFGSDATFSTKYQIGAETVFSNNFTATEPIEFELRHEVGGGMASVARANLRPVLGKLPYVGPVMIALDKVKGLQFFGVLEGGVGQESEVAWRTYYPPPNDGLTGTTNLNHVLRRHFLGGDEEVQLTQRLCFSFGAGLDILAANERAGASGRIRLQGNECGRQPAPAASVAFNSFGDWPPVARVSGNAAASVEAFLKAWVIEVGKSWEWELLTFDIQFGTEPVFQWIPMTVSQSRIAPETSTPAVFDGESPTVVDGLYPAGAYRAASGGTDAFVYTQTDPGTTSMIAEVAFGTGTNWSTPSSVTVTGGIISLDIKTIPGGGWMMVYNALDQGSIGDPYPASSLLYVTSDVAGSAWSDPMVITNLDGVVPTIKLLCSGADLGLLTLESTGGPMDDEQTLRGRMWNGAGWIQPAGAVTDLVISACAAVGHDAPVSPRFTFVHAEPGGDLHAVPWYGGAFSNRVWITNGIRPALALATDTGGTACVIWADASDGIGLSLLAPAGSVWNSPGIVLSNTQPSALALEVVETTNGPAGLVAWTEGGEVTGIHYAWLDKTGGVLRAPADLTANRTGRYRDLQTLPETGTTVQILARYTDGTTGVREFRVDLLTGASLNDRDGDGFNDLLELILIDASTDDAVTNLTDVTADGDFDGDGIANDDEFALGYDPTDEESFPYIDEIAGTHPATLWFLTGTGSMARMETSTNLLDGSGWADMGSVEGDGTFRSLTDTNEAVANRGYRLRVD